MREEEKTTSWAYIWPVVVDFKQTLAGLCWAGSLCKIKIDIESSAMRGVAVKPGDFCGCPATWKASLLFCITSPTPPLFSTAVSQHVVFSPSLLAISLFPSSQCISPASLYTIHIGNLALTSSRIHELVRSHLEAEIREPMQLMW
jgi:hypothetical protein